MCLSGARAPSPATQPAPERVDDRLLDVLMQSLREGAASLSALLPDADPVRLAQWLHRTTGAAALHHTPLFDALSDFRSCVVQGDAADIRCAGAILLATLQRIAAPPHAVEA